MMEVKFEDSQLESALKAISPEKPSFWGSPANVLSLLQTAIVAVAAVWALSQSIRFDSQRAKLAEAQAKFTLDQGRILQATEVARAGLTNKTLELDKTIKELTIREAREGRITGSANLSLRTRPGTRITDAVFSLRLKNTAKEKVEISWILLHWFLGHRYDSGRAMVTRINPPPIPFTGQSNVGPFVWQQVNYKGYIYAGTVAAAKLATLQCWSYDNGKVVKAQPPCWVFETGGPTKELLSGDYAGFEEGFEIEPRPDQWVGFVATVGIDGGYSGERLFKYVRFCDPTANQWTCSSERGSDNRVE